MALSDPSLTGVSSFSLISGCQNNGQIALNPKPDQSVIKTNRRFKRYNLCVEIAELENSAKEMLSGAPPVGYWVAWTIQRSIENPHKGLQKTSFKPVSNCE